MSDPSTYTLRKRAEQAEAALASVKERSAFWQRQCEDRERWLKEREAALAAANERAELRKHLERQRAWSEKTFGPGDRTEGVIDHIRKELREIEAAPGDLSEWIDVAILAFDGAWRSGHSPEEIVAALYAKQAKNEARQWPDWRTASKDRAIEHVREPAAPEPEAGRCKCGGQMLYPAGEPAFCARCDTVPTASLCEPGAPKPLPLGHPYSWAPGFPDSGCRACGQHESAHRPKDQA